MTPQEVAAKLLPLKTRREILLGNLVEPARAAANAMKDAGMNRTADPLMEVLFQIEAVNQEISSVMREDGFIEGFVDLLLRGPQK